MSEVRAIRAVSAEDHDWSGERAERRTDADLRERKGYKLFSGFGPNRESLVDHC